MKQLRLAVLIVLITTLVPLAFAHAQGKPDFSGTWKMDQSRSESAAQTHPIGPVTLVITQSANDLKIETTRSEGSTVMICKLDGTEITIPGGTAKTYWDGVKLVTEVERYVQGQAVTTKESRTLGSGGNEMLVDMTLVVQHGYSANTSNYGTGKDIYVRSR
jgi:hypothetical protein